MIGIDQRAAFLAHRFSLEVELVGAVHERSRMASASVGSPVKSCHLSSGSSEVAMVERRVGRSSMISSRSRRWAAFIGVRPPFVEDEQVGSGEAGEGLGVAAVAAAEVELGEPSVAGAGRGR